MNKDLIRYDILTQEAMRGVVRKVLTEVAQTGLPGEHHFFVTFNTRFPGVRVSSRVREQYPDEMTIVLQHQFWDLNVTETTMEVGLSFNSVPERLLVPFEAITAFVDPHASFGLKLEAGEEDDQMELVDADTALAESEPVSILPTPDQDLEQAEEGKASVAEPTEGDAETAETGADGDEPAETGGAEVVSLDAFRKKNG